MAFRPIWTFLMILQTLTAGHILHPKKLNGVEGEDVDFKFTTNDSDWILAANFCIRNSTDCDYMAKIVVVTPYEVTYYKNGVHFIGNISLGRAWFRTENITVEDEGVYAACIRQNTDLKRVKYEVNFTVNRSPTKDFDLCAPNPCKNGGKCTNHVNEFRCTCAAGWTDDTCETNIDLCASNPCKNGGKCTSHVSEFKCTCAAGWTDDTCETSIIPLLKDEDTPKVWPWSVYTIIVTISSVSWGLLFLFIVLFLL